MRALAAESAFPPTPPLAGAVGARLRDGSEAPRPRRFAPRRRSVALVLALALLVPAGAIAAIPDTRNAVLEWLGLRSVDVRRVPQPPRAPAPTVDNLALGERTTLAAAGRRTGLRPPLATALGAPAGVHVATQPAGGRVSVVYRPRQNLPELAPGVGALVIAFRGDRTREFVEKAAGPGTTLRRVSVGGAPGAFLAGEPHQIFFRDADGVVQPDTVRLAGNVLLWERDGIVLRLEAGVPLEEALRIARSVR
jgi:hypothetical protein